MGLDARFAKRQCRIGIQDLVDEVLVKVFAELKNVGSHCEAEDEEDPIIKRLPFRRGDALCEVHTGLRAYPFLAQVCRSWKSLLDNYVSSPELWSELVIDFGHEIVTAVHMPMEWSNKRPSDEEFRRAFTSTRLSASRILAFVERRKAAIRQLVLHNSEGCYIAENDYVPLHNKHNFTVAHLGVLLGMLYNNLEQLKLHSCNDFFRCDAQALSVIAGLSRLRVLHLEEVQVRFSADAVSELGALNQLEELVLTAEEAGDNWVVGLEAIPQSWSALTCLTHLHIRGTNLLTQLPAWLPSLPLRHLDLSRCLRLDISPISACTGLTLLALHGMALSEAPQEWEGESSGLRVLPDIWGLSRLAALQLSSNLLTRLPPSITALSSLRFLDLSHNPLLKVGRRLRELEGLGELEYVDLRDVHVEDDSSCWSVEKGTTMRNIAHLARQLKAPRRRLRGIVMANYGR